VIVGSARRTVAAPAPLQVGRWSRVTVSFGTDAVRLFIDGKPAGQAVPPTPMPDQPPPAAGYLGRRAVGGGFFSGLIGDVAVYRRATTDVAATGSDGEH
jgi:hypothetical protein